MTADPMTHAREWLRKMYVGEGPNEHGSLCFICKGKIGKAEKSVTHPPPCNSTFHLEHCDEWLKKLRSLHARLQCPVCSETVGVNNLYSSIYYDRPASRFTIEGANHRYESNFDGLCLR